MALPSFCTETVTRLRAPYLADRYGNEASDRDWSLATELDIQLCSVQPMIGAETLVDRDAVENHWILYGPPGIDVVATDRIRHNGITYEVQSDIRRWPSATGALSNTQMELERVDG